MSHEIPTEFERPVNAQEAVAAGSADIVLEADSGERAALARRFGLEGLDRLEARFSLTGVENGGFAVSGTVSADVVQACVITLEPIWSSVQTSLAVTYAPGAGPQTEDIDPDVEMPEPLPKSGRIDLGELAAQYLALALDPYPRKPGARLPGERTPGAGGPESPFAALAKLKERDS